jgi:hypothetical protein
MKRQKPMNPRFFVKKPQGLTALLLFRPNDRVRKIEKAKEGVNGFLESFYAHFTLHGAPRLEPHPIPHSFLGARRRTPAPTKVLALKGHQTVPEEVKTDLDAAQAEHPCRARLRPNFSKGAAT